MSPLTDVAHDVEAVSPALPPIIGVSEVLREAVDLARRAARSHLPVLLIAPTGCGKELLAQYIHAWSGRPGEVVDVNCAAVPESLIESELFGHASGAFTGARGAKRGLIEVADGQSFFLDEVPSLSLPLQAKLLRVLETQELRRVGEVAKRRVEVRFLAAAQEDLGHRVIRGAFRRDLYYRLAGVVIRIPPLAERVADVLPLAAYFADRVGRRVDAAAELALLEYGWPGNVRELRMVIERAACMADGPVISGRSIAYALRLGDVYPSDSSRNGTTRVLRVFADTNRALRKNRSLLAEVVARHRGSIAQTARALQLPRATLQRWLREVGL